LTKMSWDWIQAGRLGDPLPYKIQSRTLFTLVEPLDSLGYKRLNHWP
jgi:hypothetical protein